MSIKTIMLVRKILAAEDRVVTYRPDGHTLCPVCQFLGLPPGKVIPYKTIKELRYYYCEQCNANFRASGPTPAELKAARLAEEAKAVEAEKHVRQTKIEKIEFKKQAKQKVKQNRKR
jgi:hypothetical protein